MTECNENNKDSYVLPDRSAQTEKDKTTSPFFAITFGILGSLVCGVFLITSDMEYPTGYCNLVCLGIYFFCICLLGLEIGWFISYGAKQTRYNNKKILFILTFVSSFFAYLMHSVLMCICTGSNVITYFIKDLTRNPTISLHSFLYCIAVIVISGLILDKQNSYKKKHLLFILILLSLIIIFVIFNLVVLYSSEGYHINFFGYFVDQLWNQATYRPLYDKLPEMSDGIDYILEDFVYGILRIYETITFGRVYKDDLLRIINIQVWLLAYFITVFCAWKFIIFTCPWLSPSDSSVTEKKNWYSFLIKAVRRRSK